MIDIRTAGSRFQTLMFTDSGIPFLGTVDQLGEGRIPSYDFSEPRLLLRVDPHINILSPGVVMIDRAGRNWLLATNDTAFTDGELEYTTFRMLHINAYPTWTREQTIIDTLTRQPKGNGKVVQGNPPCLIERTDREFADSTIRSKEESKRVFTAAPLQLGDQLEEMTVKRVDNIWGIILAEIQ